MNGFMKEHMAAARAWWDDRTAREHVMLGVLAAVVGLVLTWLLVVSPLLAWKAAAADRLQRAVQTRALAAAASGLDPGWGAARSLTEVERLAVEAALSAGIETQLRVEEEGVAFAVESAETAALFGWIAALERTHRLRVVSLSVLENADATLQAQGTLGS